MFNSNSSPIIECDTTMDILQKICYSRARKIYPHIKPTLIACFVYFHHLGCKYPKGIQDVIENLKHGDECARPVPAWLALQNKHIKHQPLLIKQKNTKLFHLDNSHNNNRVHPYRRENSKRYRYRRKMPRTN
jgi:hypothetical protein